MLSLFVVVDVGDCGVVALCVRVLSMGLWGCNVFADDVDDDRG